MKRSILWMLLLCLLLFALAACAADKASPGKNTDSIGDQTQVTGTSGTGMIAPEPDPPETDDEGGGSEEEGKPAELPDISGVNGAEDGEGSYTQNY